MNFSHFSANVKFSPSFLFEEETNICGLLQKKKKKIKLARGHSVSNPACMHLPHVPDISAAKGVCCTAVWNLKWFCNNISSDVSLLLETKLC